MPELPEVETTVRAITPYLEGKRICKTVLRTEKLRYPLQQELAHELPGQLINTVERRGRFILLRTDEGSIIIHLGMTGSLAVFPASSPANKHDHVDLVMEDNCIIRFCDPRRFGLMLWTKEDPLAHKLLAGLGPEPLGSDFNGDYLFARSRGRRSTIKQFIMDGRVVTGIGNIYACEALFRAGLDPSAAAGDISLVLYERLIKAIKEVLTKAVASGEKALASHPGLSGSPRYFPLETAVYGRKGKPCICCPSIIRVRRIGGRSTFYCPGCQN